MLAIPQPPTPLASEPPKKPSRSDKALEAGLRKKLVELASQPLTPRTLFQLEQTARLARELFTMHQAPSAMGANPLAQVGWQVGQAMGQMFTPGVINGSYTSGTGTLAPSSPAETWGANAVREIVAKSGDDKPEDPVRLIEALARAKEEKLSDKVIQALEERLGVEPPHDKKANGITLETGDAP